MIYFHWLNKIYVILPNETRVGELFAGIILEFNSAREDSGVLTNCLTLRSHPLLFVSETFVELINVFLARLLNKDCWIINRKSFHLCRFYLCNLVQEVDVISEIDFVIPYHMLALIWQSGFDDFGLAIGRDLAGVLWGQVGQAGDQGKVGLLVMLYRLTSEI